MSFPPPVWFVKRKSGMYSLPVGPNVTQPSERPRREDQHQIVERSEITTQRRTRNTCRAEKWVETSLFRACCTPLCAHWWFNYKKGLQRLQVARNDAMRPRWSVCWVKTFQAVFRNRMYKFVCRVNDSENEVILVSSNIKFSSRRYRTQLHCLVIKPS